MKNGIGSVGGQLDGVVVGKLDLSHGVVIEKMSSFVKKNLFFVKIGSL